MDNDEYVLLADFVKIFNASVRNGEFAFLVEKEQQMSAKSTIKSIIEKREAERKRREEHKRIKKEKQLNKLAKTQEQKRTLLEQLKKELGE